MARIRILKAKEPKRTKVISSGAKKRKDDRDRLLAEQTEGNRLRSLVSQRRQEHLSGLKEGEQPDEKFVSQQKVNPRDIGPTREAGSVPQFKPTPSPEPAPSVTPAEPLGIEPEKYTELTSVRHQPKDSKHESLARQRAEMMLGEHKKEGGETAGANKEQQMAAQRLLSQFGFAEELNQLYGHNMANNAIYDAWVDEVISPRVEERLAQRRAAGHPPEEGEREQLLNYMLRRATMNMTPDQQKSVMESAMASLRAGTARPSAPPAEPERKPGHRAQAKAEREAIREKVKSKEITPEEGQAQIDAINEALAQKRQVKVQRRDERLGRQLDELVEHPEMYHDEEGNVISAIDLARQMYDKDWNTARDIAYEGKASQKIRGGTRVKFGRQVGGGDPKTEQGTTNLVQGDPILDPATGEQKIDPETGKPMFEMVPEINIRSTAPKRGEGWDPETGEIDERYRSLSQAADMPTSLTEEEKKIRRRLPSGGVKETTMTSGEQATRRAGKAAERKKEMERRLRAAAVTGSGRGGTRQLTEEGKRAVQEQKAREKRLVTELLAEEIKENVRQHGEALQEREDVNARLEAGEIEVGEAQKLLADIDKRIEDNQLGRFGLTHNRGATQARANELAALRAQMESQGKAGLSAQQARQAAIDAITPEISERERTRKKLEVWARKAGMQYDAGDTGEDSFASRFAGKLKLGINPDQAVEDIRAENEAEEKYSVPEAFETSPAVQTLDPPEPDYKEKVPLDPMGIIPAEDWGATRDEVLERMGMIDEDPLAISEEEMAALQAATTSDYTNVPAHGEAPKSQPTPLTEDATITPEKQEAEAPAAEEIPMMTEAPAEPEEEDAPEESAEHIPVDEVPRGDMPLPEFGGAAAPVAGAPDVPLIPMADKPPAPPREDDTIQQSMGLYNPYNGDEMLKAVLTRMYQ